MAVNIQHVRIDGFLVWVQPEESEAQPKGFEAQLYAPMRVLWWVGLRYRETQQDNRTHIGLIRPVGMLIVTNFGKIEHTYHLPF